MPTKMKINEFDQVVKKLAERISDYCMVKHHAKSEPDTQVHEYTWNDSGIKLDMVFEVKDDNSDSIFGVPILTGRRVFQAQLRRDDETIIVTPYVDEELIPENILAFMKNVLQACVNREQEQAAKKADEVMKDILPEIV